uniref:Armadillo repeat-containing protein 8 n=1 Tax=Xenopsylla cheopis TaxID=163159 RepID=A0A6M2DVK8_XENCH
MHPFTCFMDVETSRTYIDDLYSENIERCLDAMVMLKNSVIGSNRQKGSIIAKGVVPKIMQLLAESPHEALKLEAAVTLSSLAKGSSEHIQALVDCGCVQLLLNIISSSCRDKLTETCLSALRSLYTHRATPVELLQSENNVLELLLRLAGPDSSVTTQACVASLLNANCRNHNGQNVLWKLGTCQVLVRLIASPFSNVQIPALSCMTSMIYENPTIAQAVYDTSHDGTQLHDLLVRLTSRSQPADIQLRAARCLSLLHRGGALSASDKGVAYGALPCLVRLCAPDKDISLAIRARAAESLAYLAEVNTSLQRIAAISNHLIASLADLLNSGDARGKQAAFRCFASLGANDEDIRKRIIEIEGLMDHVLTGLEGSVKDKDDKVVQDDKEKDYIEGFVGDDDVCSKDAVRLAAVKCLLSLSRSVQQLRTTFQDHSVWKPLMSVLTQSQFDRTSSTFTNTSTELLTVTTSTLCNLLLEFSPAKEPMLECGVLELLCDLTSRSEAPLRLNGVWALMNIAFQAEQKMKKRILASLGMPQIFRLLEDSDTEVIMKTLGLLRNLLSPRSHIDDIMTDYSNEVLRAVSRVLDAGLNANNSNNNSNDIPMTTIYPSDMNVNNINDVAMSEMSNGVNKLQESTNNNCSTIIELTEQALCILGNICDGQVGKEYVMADERLLHKLADFIMHPEPKLQAASLYAVSNLVWKTDQGSERRQARLRELGIYNLLERIVTDDEAIFDKVKTTITQFDS